MLLHFSSYSLPQQWAMEELPIRGDAQMSSVALHRSWASRPWDGWMTATVSKTTPETRPGMGTWCLQQQQFHRDRTLSRGCWAGPGQSSGGSMSSFHPLHLVVCGFSIIGNKILPGAICSTPVTHTAYLPRAPEIWSLQCFHNPARALTLEEWGSFSEPCLALWGHSLLRSVVALLPYGISGVSGQVQCHGQHCFCPQGRAIVIPEMLPEPLKRWHVVVLCEAISLYPNNQLLAGSGLW